MTDVNVQALAKLARLAVSDTELEKLRTQIPAILAFVETIQGVQTPDEGTGSGAGVLREDANPHEGGMYTKRLLDAAPKTAKGYVVVKQVVSRKK